MIRLSGRRGYPFLVQKSSVQKEKLAFRVFDKPGLKYTYLLRYPLRPELKGSLEPLLIVQRHVIWMDSLIGIP
jgi:hypothetical protein